jgi:hypothetical protein
MLSSPTDDQRSSRRRIRSVTVGIRLVTQNAPSSTACRGGDMTTVIARAASRAAASNRMPPARPDQLSPAPPAVAISAAGTAAWRSGVSVPVAWTDPCGDDGNCGNLLSTAASPTRDSEHRSQTAAGGARPGRRAGHPVVPAARAGRRARRTGKSRQAAGPGGTQVLRGAGLRGLGAYQRPGAVSGKHGGRAGRTRHRWPGDDEKHRVRPCRVVRMGQQPRTG